MVQVNIQDLVLVAGALGTSAAAHFPTASRHLYQMLTAADVKLWLSQDTAIAHHRCNVTTWYLCSYNNSSIALTPKKTALLANYPNPFNPRDVDTLSLGKRRECYTAYLCCERRIGADVDARTSNRRDVSKSYPCGVLGW